MLTYNDMETMSSTNVFEIPRTSKHIAVLMNGSQIQGVFTNCFAYHAEENAVAFYMNSHKLKTKNLKLFVAKITRDNRMSRPCKHWNNLITVLNLFSASSLETPLSPLRISLSKKIAM